MRYVEPLECRRMFVVEDPFEVNDTFALATDLGAAGDFVVDNVTIHSAADQDYFKVTTAEPGELKISISFINALGDLDLFLYNDNEQLIDDSLSTDNTEEVSTFADAGMVFYALVVGFQNDVNDYDLTVDGADPDGIPAWLDVASSATWNDAAQTLIVTGPTEIIADPADSGDHPIINVDGSSITFNQGGDLQAHIAELNLSNFGTATIGSLGAARTASNHRVLVTDKLSIDGTSKLNVTDNDVIVDYTGSTPAGPIEADVAGGYNAVGDWAGYGIVSSIAGNDGNFTVGVAENASLPLPFGTAQGGPLFAGVDVDLTSVLVKFTHRADINLDGLVTPDDSAIFGGNYDENQFANWATGDLNYDGLFTPDDSAVFGGAYDETLALV